MYDIMSARECFKSEAHAQHIWHEQFTCTGAGISDGRTVASEQEILATFEALAYSPLEEKEEQPKEDETTPAPGILDGRAAYGDRVQNMKEQAAMINAYLGTPPRAIEAHDVPIIFVLIKAHRLGKMPDYADNYNDIDGYMQIAREVIGNDMIEAATAKEYSQLKAVRNANTNVVEAKAVQAWLADHGVVSDVVTVDHSVPPRHPYENVERDEFTASILDSHDPGVHELPKPRHQYENVERDAERDAMNERLRQSRNAR